MYDFEIPSIECLWMSVRPNQSVKKRKNTNIMVYIISTVLVPSVVLG
jgi:hypothetical protein